MKKLVCGALCLVLGVAQAETTGDYVQDGLIAMWDGWENDGAGGHATSLTEWKDTSGQYSFVFNENSGIRVEDNRLVLSGESGCYVWVPIGGLILVALEVPLHLLADLRLKGLKAISSENEPDIAKDAPAASSMTDFVKNNGRFCLMLIGTVLIFIAHNLDCNFLTEINNALGGTSATIGYISAFTAIVEVPVMVFFVPVFGKMRESTLMRFAFVMFVFKMLAYALSPSIPVLFAARILQAPSYALYTAATVPYVSKVIAPRDANKGQSLAFTMSTVGSIIANTFGGTMFEQLGKTQTLLIGVVITAAGAALAYIGIQKVSKNVPDAARE